MNKKEYIAATAEKTDGISKATVEEVLKAFTETITEGLIKGERIPIVGLGAFETADVEERIGKNPKLVSQSIFLLIENLNLKSVKH